MRTEYRSDESDLNESVEEYNNVMSNEIILIYGRHIIIYFTSASDIIKVCKSCMPL